MCILRAHTGAIYRVYRVKSLKLPHAMQVMATDVFTLDREGCPPGYNLIEVSSGYYECDCNVNNQDIVDCERGRLVLQVRLS